ncbi:MAG TPA: hypothetical protein VHM89_08050 [Acidimicrobiales bacterium]|nr:hypothetical protein [Acidimicrobiales bacterium]
MLPHDLASDGAKKRLAMGSLVVAGDAHTLVGGGGVVERLGTKEERCARLALPHQLEMLYNSDSVGRVAKARLRLPPPGFTPALTATASTRVDFPVPFSPTKKVTVGPMSSWSRDATAGMENGYDEDRSAGPT